MQIQYNITRIEEWCKSHDMPEGTLQLEHLMQATKLLQLKKVRLALPDVELSSHFAPGYSSGYRDHLRRLLDAHAYANSAYVHKLPRRRLRGASPPALAPTSADMTSIRLPSLLRSFAWWHPASTLTTGMITCSFRQRRKKSGLTNCHYQETFLALRHMYPHTSTFPTSGGWLRW